MAAVLEVKKRSFVMRRQIVSLVEGLLMLVLVVPVARSQKSEGDAVAEITRLEQESVKSDLANDRSFSDKYLADDFTAGDSFGEWETKQSILKDMSDPHNNKTTKEEMSDLKVRVYGNTAIATYKETYDSLYHGEPRARTIIVTETWVKQGGKWKEVAGHASQAAK
jgi:ketosteroid isomerase-like protein